MAAALAASGLPPRHIWACALHDHLESAAAYLIYGGT